jgi:hypothetical protein
MNTTSSLLSKIKLDAMGLHKGPRALTKGDWRGYKEVTKLVRFVNGITLHYSNRLGFSQLEILEAMEKRRTYWSMNFYQAANFPRIGKKVEVFENLKGFYTKFPSHKYICPLCEGQSNNPQICDTGLAAKTNSGICDWKAFGLFGTLGKGYSFLIKDSFLDEPKVYNIFMPLELA